MTSNFPPVPSPHKVIAVTGAGRGLGLATTRQLLSDDCHVIAHYRTPSPDLSALHTQYPQRLTLVQGDIQQESTAQAITAHARRLGRLDALISNAAATSDQVLVRLSLNDWNDVQRTNVTGAFLVTKHALKLMMRQRAGRIIYVSSISALLGNAGQAAYATSKAALDGLARTVSQEYAPYNVSAVVLAPGLITTGLGAATPKAVQQEKLSRTLGPPSSAAAVAEVIAFLTRPAALTINATTVHMHGGIRF